MRRCELLIMVNPFHPIFTLPHKACLITICSLLFIQCALRPIPRDLTTYVNRDIYGISELEHMSLARYAELTGDNFISDEILQSSLKTEIIPTYSRFIELVSRIKPKTDPVKELHALYREAAVLRLSGFQSISLAIESQDPHIIRQANYSLNRGQELVDQWQTQLSRLAMEHKLNLD